VAPAPTMALHGVAAEKGGEGLEKGLGSGISQLSLGRWRKSPGWPREDARAVRTDANLVQIWTRDGSDRTRRYGYIAPLKKTLVTRRSDRINSDARERNASARPYLRSLARYSSQ
jgi:hypothetical protein